MLPSKVQKDTFLIHVEADRNSDIGIIGANGKKIIIDADYNKYKHTVQIGKIFACPIQITSQYLNDTPLKVGDTVVFHHFVCQPDHKVNLGENIYRAEYFHLYAKIISILEFPEMKTTGHLIEPLEDIIFVEPVLEDESALYAGKIRIKTYQENIKQQGIVFAASKKARSMGVLPGDKIHFTASADYSMKIGEQGLYRMRIRNVVAVERDGELICLEGKILVKQQKEVVKIGGFIDVGVKHELTGTVIRVGGTVEGVEEGSILSYYNSALGSIVRPDGMYSMIETRNINYIKN